MDDDDEPIFRACLRECKRRLDHYRSIGDELQAELAQADMDAMLDSLQDIYKRREPQT